MMDWMLPVLGLLAFLSVGFVIGWLVAQSFERDKRRRHSRYLPNDYSHRRDRY